MLPFFSLCIYDRVLSKYTSWMMCFWSVFDNIYTGFLILFDTDFLIFFNTVTTEWFIILLFPFL